MSSVKIELNEAELGSLLRVLDYLGEEERDHYCEYDAPPENHICQDVLVVTEALSLNFEAVQAVAALQRAGALVDGQ